MTRSNIYIHMHAVYMNTNEGISTRYMKVVRVTMVRKLEHEPIEKHLSFHLSHHYPTLDYYKVETPRFLFDALNCPQRTS